MRVRFRACWRFGVDGNVPLPLKRKQACALQRRATKILSGKHKFTAQYYENDHCDLDAIGLKFNFSQTKDCNSEPNMGRRPFIAEELPTDQATPNSIVDRRSLDYYRACPRPPRGHRQRRAGCG